MKSKNSLIFRLTFDTGYQVEAQLGFPTRSIHFLLCCSFCGDLVFARQGIQENVWEEMLQMQRQRPEIS